MALDTKHRTHACASIDERLTGQSVTLCGWVHRRRDLGQLIFIDLRDRYGIVQIVFNPDVFPEPHEKAKTLRSEFVIQVHGKIIAREAGNVNLNLPSGKVELVAEALTVLSEALTPPFPLNEENSRIDEDLRLEYRYLDIRRAPMREALILRHRICQLIRRHFSDHEFIEVETPVLMRSTPEGARDYLVPSRVHAGKFYALPQSPQIYKQLLMVAGLDRYFQIVKCFRDEDLRADRQPEFTQVDVEMSFVDQDDVIRVIESLMQRLFHELLDVGIALPLKRLTYQDAMERYGSDKPDLRFDLPIVDVTEHVRQSEFQVFKQAVDRPDGMVACLSIKGRAEEFSRKKIDQLTDFVKPLGLRGLATLKIGAQEIQSSISKFVSADILQNIVKTVHAEPGDFVIIAAERREILLPALGALRLKLGEELDLIDRAAFAFVWIVDFPLFEYDEVGKRLVAMHHPFTSPRAEDVALLGTRPEKVHARAYDLVLNGNEIGGGSIRIFDKTLQNKMFDALGLTAKDREDKFGFLLRAFEYGVPPHGGIALGLDRIVALMAGRRSIRDVIAFPKTNSAVSLMDRAPSEVDDRQLKELHIRLLHDA
jgi:aspartyl-tRNA synthetase